MEKEKIKKKLYLLIYGFINSAEKKSKYVGKIYARLNGEQGTGLLISVGPYS